MKFPAYLHGVALLIWGVQVDMLVFAVPMAVLLESSNFTGRRWVFSRKEFYLLADVTAAAILGITIYYFTSARSSHFLFFLLELAPLIFYPMLLALNFSTTEKLSADIFMYSMRRRGEGRSNIVEFDHLYVGLCLIAMSTAVESRDWFPTIAILLVGWTLWVNRPKRSSSLHWLLIMALMIGVGLVGQQGLRESHLYVKKKSLIWLAGLIRNNTDPYKTRTALGRVGQLKLSDEILFRIKGDGSFAVPELLQEASYDTPSERDWMVLNPGFKLADKLAHDSWRWSAESAGEKELSFYYEFKDDKLLLPVPSNSGGLKNFTAVEINTSLYGSIQAIGITPTPVYQVIYDGSGDINTPPTSSDTYLPEYYRELMVEVLGALATIEDPIERIRSYFEDFRYTLYQPEHDAWHDPLVRFLTRTRAGHCEYFASATVMMLRSLDVPARYVVGYSVQEYSPTTDMYLIRSRHAHAWALAFLDNRWQVIDTTPSVWLEAEAAEAPFMQPLYDLISERLFQARYWWSTRTEAEKSMGLVIIAVLMGAFLAWRMMGSPQVVMNRSTDNAPARRVYPGADSAFYRIEAELLARGQWRQTGESATDWLIRIDHRELLGMLMLHYRARFDPHGLGPEEIEQLGRTVDAWLGDQITTQKP